MSTTSEQPFDGALLDRLFEVIQSRRGADPKISRTARLFKKGVPKVAQKVGEEATEVVIEGVSGPADKLAEESADLLYHLLVLWSARGLEPLQVWTVLAERAQPERPKAKPESNGASERSDEGESGQS